MRTCAECGKSIEHKRSNAKYCNVQCRKRKSRQEQYANGVKPPRTVLREARIAELGYEFDGDCEICGITVTIPHVDHDHVTGKARGYVCLRCNVGLGYFQDDYDRLINAAGYLRSKQ